MIRGYKLNITNASQAAKHNGSKREGLAGSGDCGHWEGSSLWKLLILPQHHGWGRWGYILPMDGDAVHFCPCFCTLLVGVSDYMNVHGEPRTWVDSPTLVPIPSVTFGKSLASVSSVFHSPIRDNCSTCFTARLWAWMHARHDSSRHIRGTLIHWNFYDWDYHRYYPQPQIPWLPILVDIIT